jgi:PAS domain S-box-containing protein
LTESVSLESIIRKKTLPRLLSFLLLTIFCVVVGSLYAINQQLKQRHLEYADSFIEDFQLSLNLLQSQVSNLATNDLIVNSVIDYSNRDNYLPVFFRSLKLNITHNITIVFTDFDGNVITGQAIELFLEKQADFSWQNRVLEQAMPYFEYSSKGVFAAFPVIYADSAEGAIIAYVSEVQSVLNLNNSNNLILLLDGNNQVLFSSNETEQQAGTQYSKSDFQHWFSVERSFDQGKVISLQPKELAYKEALLSSLFMLLALVIVFLVALSGIRHASALVSASLKALQKNIDDSMVDKQAIASVELLDEPQEFKAIRVGFKQLLQQLQATSVSKNKFESVLNSLNEMLLVIDSAGLVILCNASLDEFIVEHQLSLPADLGKLLPLDFINNDLDSQSSIDVSYNQSSMRHDNSVGCPEVKWFKRAYLNDNGERLGTLLTGINVTQERVLQSQVDIRNKAIDEAHTALFIAEAINEQLPITYVNKAFTQLTGFTAEEILSQDCRHILQKMSTLSAEPNADIVTASKRSHCYTQVNHRKDNSPFYNEITLTPIFDQVGRISHVIGSFYDVSEREATEAYLTNAKTKAEESARLKSDFLASMSHEIRTPMNGIIGMLRILSHSHIDKEQRHHLAIAQSSAQSLLTLLNDILDFSKIEAGKLELDEVDFEIVETLTDMFDSLVPKAQEKGIELILDFSEVKPHEFYGDSGRLRQIVNNLVGNAIKFTAKGNVLISADVVEKSDDEFIFSCVVKDDGIGVPVEKQKHIFNSFTQADASTTREYGGTGLGLAITTQLCQLMNGSISIESDGVNGSRFIFEVVFKTSTQPLEASYLLDLSAVDILLVEDNTIAAESIKKQLQLWGANVTISTSPLDAPAVMKAAEQELMPFQLVIIEMKLTDIDGLTLKRRIDEELPDSTSKFILMTSSLITVDITKLSQFGFQGYFHKPATLIKLHQTIQAVINGQGIEYDETELSISPHKLVSDSTENVPALLVEDNPTNQIVASFMLNHLGIEVSTASNGVEALKLLQSSSQDKPFQLIFMDCQMPEMDGFEATKRIRAGEGGECYRHAPIIAMTANAIKGDKERCLAEGMDDYISKPIDAVVLENRINYWLQKIAPERSDTVKTPVSEVVGEPSNLVWNIQQLSKRLNGKTELIQLVIKAFTEDTPKQVDQLQLMIKDQQLEQVRAISHSIKGAASNIDAEQLAEIAKSIETAAIEQDINLIISLSAQLLSIADELYLELNKFSSHL